MTDLKVTGDLTVDGTSTLDGMITCRSDSFFTGFLRVGALAGVGFNVLEALQVNQFATIGGDTTLQGALAVTGETTLSGNLTVSGANGLTVEGPVVIDDILRTNTPHGIVCGGELAVAGDATLQETLTLQGLATLEKGAAITGGDLAVTTIKGSSTSPPTMTTSIDRPGLVTFVNPGGSGRLTGQVVFRGTGASAQVLPGDTVTLDFGTPFNSTMRVFLQTSAASPTITWGGCSWDITSQDQQRVTMVARGAASDDFGGDNIMSLTYLSLQIGFV